MLINELSPLQNWLQRIEGYLTKKEIMKARLASLVLPVFEALAFCKVMRKICFESSVTLPVSRSHLAGVATILAFNVLFSSYQGFMNPRRHYQFHKDRGLVYKKPDLLEDDRTAYTQEYHPFKKDVLIKSSPTGSSPAKADKQNRSPSTVEKRRKILKKAPSLLKTKTVQERKAETKDASLSKKGAEWSQTQAIFSEKSLENNILISDVPLVQDELESIRPLIDKQIQAGSLRVKKGKIVFKVGLGKQLICSTGIIDVVHEALVAGLLSKLDFSQMKNLHHNLHFISGLNLTIKQPKKIENWRNISEFIQSRLLTLWIQDDITHNKFYENCKRLIFTIHQLIEKEENDQENGHRLFNKPISAELYENFIQWQNFKPSRSNASGTAVYLTIFDYYDILKAYLNSVPTPISKQWDNLTLHKGLSYETWKESVLKLPLQDREIIYDILQMLRAAYGKINKQWRQDDAEIAFNDLLTATHDMTSRFCPSAIVKEIVMGLDIEFLKN